MIQEQDLFNYVFFLGSLTEHKKSTIESEKSFMPVLDLYKSIKENLANTPEKAVKEMIAEKIPAYSLPDVIHLFPLYEHPAPKRSGRLAADSKELKAKMTTKTFVDNDKEYLIKVLNYGNMTKIFVFSTKDELIKNFNIVIEPLNLRYHFEDNSEPLKIENTIDAQGIRLEIQ